MPISYLDNDDHMQETNNFTERGEGGGYIIYDLDGRNGEYFLPYNRVFYGQMELEEFILSTNNSRIVPLSQLGNRSGSKKSKKKRRKHKSKKGRSKKQRSKKKRSRKKSKKR